MLRSTRAIRCAKQVVALGAIAVGFGCGAASSSGDDELCDLLEGAEASCEGDDCASALARDCEVLPEVVTPSFRDAVIECLQDFGAPLQCLDDAAQSSLATSEFERFSETMCLACGDGTSECIALVQDGLGETDFARAGKLTRALSSDVISEIEESCTASDGCAAAFESCATSTLARTIPTETARCLVGGILDGTDANCDQGSGNETSGTGDAGGDENGDDDAGDSGVPDDDGGSDDETGGGPDSCVTEGCACQFNDECEGDLVCIDQQCSAPLVCEDDPNEPNDAEGAATYLPPIGDSDSEGSSILAELDGATDVDWYRYQGSDNIGSLVNPAIYTSIFSLESCIFIECLGGAEYTNVDCPEGTNQKPSASGIPGCCSTNSEGFQMHFACDDTFTDDSANVYMRVSGGPADLCQQYSIDYHF